jgi:ATP phosphoribosyltransferase
MPESSTRLVFAVPKGRILEPLSQMLSTAGFDGGVLLRRDRKLVREDRQHDVGFLLLKPDDVPTYVEYGAADVGVVGRDVLLERSDELYVPVELGIGRCRMVVAGPKDGPPAPRRDRTLRVATKYPSVAAQHFFAQGRPVEIIFVQGSVELAPLTGMTDVIVDLVESGETLRRNGLHELEHVRDISSVVIANRVGLKLKRERLGPLLQALSEAACDT